MQHYNIEYVTHRCPASFAIQRWFNLLSITSHKESRYFIYKKITELTPRKENEVV
jgi:hypothetical protein